MPKLSLYAARVSADLTQEEAARRLGISRITLSNWETGKREPKASQIDSILELYQLPYERIDFSRHKNLR